MSSTKGGDGDAVVRFFTVSMLAGEVKVGPFGAASTVADLQRAVEEMTGKDCVRLEVLGCDMQLDRGMLLNTLPSDVDAVAAVVTPPIVLDVGSLRVRAGFAGHEAPCFIFRSVVGKPRAAGSTAGPVVGEEAIEKRGVLSLKYPVEFGVVTDWDAMAAIWRHAFVGLGVPEVARQAVIMTEPPLNPKNNRETLAQFMFESFGVAKFFLMCSSSAALLAMGCRTGVVLDIGHRSRRCVPVFDGHVLLHGVSLYDRGAGEELTEQLMHALGEKGISLTTSRERELADLLKEQLCYVAERGAAAEMGKAEPRKVELPGLDYDVSLSDERFLVPELLFDPYRFYRGDHYRAGLHNQVCDAVMRCDLECRPEILRNVVLTGGSSLFQGLAERLRFELEKEVHPAHQVKVLAASNSNREWLSWLGTSQAVSLDYFKTLWVTTDEYDEHGPSMVHRKSFW